MAFNVQKNLFSVVRVFIFATVAFGAVAIKVETVVRQADTVFSGNFALAQFDGIITEFDDFTAVEADKVIVMDQGKIVMQGTPKEVFSHVEELKSYRLDVPQATLVAYELQKKGVPLPDGILSMKEQEQELEKLRA